MGSRRFLPLLALGVLLGVAVRPTAAEENVGDGAAPVAGDAISAATDLRASLRSLADAGRDGDLLQAADLALAKEPGSAVALEYRAFALQRLGYAGPAIEAYERLVAAVPDHVWGLTRLGALMAQAGNGDRAREVLGRALELDETAADARWRLVAVLRDQGAMVEAERLLVAGLAVGADPARAHAELAYLRWARGDAKGAAASWKAAAAAGADRVVVDHGRRLLVWERRAGQSASVARLRGEGHVWTPDVPGLSVQSSLGPKLPNEVNTLLTALPARYAAFFGLETSRRGPIAVRLSRTIEEHETHRRRLFPAGSVGRAFLVPGFTAGRRPRRDQDATSERPDTIYATWASPTFLTSLSHELAHAVLIDRARGVPVWLDEGLATYLELPRDGDVDADPSRPRSDLLAELERARVAGRLRSLQAVVAVTRRELDGAHGREHYAAVWSVVHFLLHGVGAEGAGRHERFQSLLDAARPRGRRGGGREPASLSRIYGLSDAALDRAWKRHLATIGDR